MATTNNDNNFCIICTEKFNKVSHTQVPCEYCEFIACRSCCETYIKSEGISKCMNKDKKNGVFVCEKEWSRRHTSTFMTKTFMSKEYKKIKEKQLLDVQKSLLPATMDIVKIQIERERSLREIQRMDQQIHEINVRKKQMYVAMRATNNQNQTTSSQYVRACPAESCRGYLNAQWKCLLCELTTCSECHVVKPEDTDVEHVCDPDQCATAKLLAKDTRQCPKCQEGIFKISGCDQMWCTQCRTAFSWITGRIETTIHNPHYYQWLRANANGGEIPRNPGDIPREIDDGCGGGPEFTINRIKIDFIRTMTNYAITQYAGVPSKILEVQTMQNELDDIVRSRNHLYFVQAPLYRTDRMQEDTEQLALRIDFLRNKIDEQTFVTRTQRREKDVKKRQEIYNVMTLFHTATYDLIMRINQMTPLLIKVDNISGEKAWKKDANIDEFTNGFKDILGEIRCLVRHANELFDEIAKTYASKKKHLHIYGVNKNRNNDVFAAAINVYHSL